MQDVVFIGDEITALGFRLAGLETHSPDPDALAARVAELRGTARVMLMTPETFDALPLRLAQELADREHPLLALIPDACRTAPVPDMELEVKRALGIET